MFNLIMIGFFITIYIVCITINAVQEGGLIKGIKDIGLSFHILLLAGLLINIFAFIPLAQDTTVKHPIVNIEKEKVHHSGYFLGCGSSSDELEYKIYSREGSSINCFFVDADNCRIEKTTGMEYYTKTLTDDKILYLHKDTIKQLIK